MCEKKQRVFSNNEKKRKKQVWIASKEKQKENKKY